MKDLSSTANSTSPIQKNAEVELEIQKLAFGGKALARSDGYVIFVENAIPGQRVRVRIHRKKRQYAEGRVVQVLSQSPAYTPPFCTHFGTCGGCSWQDLAYEQQLFWKRLHVVESLEHMAGLDGVEVEPTILSPDTTFYRNKMEYTFADRRWLTREEIAQQHIDYGKSFALGLHVRGFFDKVFNVEECFLQSAHSVEILRSVRRWCQESGLAPYTTRTHEGFWRFLVIREGKRTGQTLMHIITGAHPRGTEVVDALSRHLLDRFPEITTLIHSISHKKAQVATGDLSRNVVGPGHIEEILGGHRFQISAHSFFQTNTCAAEKLYETISRFAECSGNETVWDLYCGTGSIAISLAPQVRSVVGFEMVEDAIRDAYRNCTLNGIDNCRFEAGDLKDRIVQAQERGAPDVVITDPPRAGMHPTVTKALLELAPRRIVAVSCNPSTLARDLSVLQEHYAVHRIQPLDLFPHTPHIECVVQLEKK